MPTPRINNKTQTRERPTYNDLFWEQLQDTKTEVRETRKELNARMDKLEENLNARMDNIEQRMDKLDTKIDTTRRELNERMEKFDAKLDAIHNEIRQELKAMHNEIKSSTGHISIANISTVGIAFGVLYSILSK